MTESRLESKSFCKAMFAGNIAQDIIFPFPEMDAGEKDNLKLILDSLRQFAKDNIDSAEIDRSCEIPREVLDGLAEMGLFGMSIPEAYGGYGSRERKTGCQAGPSSGRCLQGPLRGKGSRPNGRL